MFFDIKIYEQTLCFGLKLLTWQMSSNMKSHLISRIFLLSRVIFFKRSFGRGSKHKYMNSTCKISKETALLNLGENRKWCLDGFYGNKRRIYFKYLTYVETYINKIWTNILKLERALHYIINKSTQCFKFLW